jgi:hypothetical protein
LGLKSTWTEPALTENEISKKQRFISVRDLTQRAGRALLELKPCWMISPLAVAQYGPKKAIHFDLCIIDEPSQMPPESVNGAVALGARIGITSMLPANYSGPSFHIADYRLTDLGRCLGSGEAFDKRE